MRQISISADGDHVAALFAARSAGGDELWIAETPDPRDDNSGACWFFYHDTRPLESPRTAPTFSTPKTDGTCS